jgi:copper oxidase (laccase) domain-containing protein
LDEGFKNENIEISKISTYCHKNLFSYRKEMEKVEASGRLFALFAIKI